MSIDYRTLLAPAETVRASDGMMSIVVRSADDLLATRIPDLCPDCNEHGMRWMGRVTDDGDGPWVHCTHPNAPTIADLLRWGGNVAKAGVRTDHLGSAQWVESCAHVGDRCFDADDVGLLAALRTEAEQSGADR